MGKIISSKPLSSNEILFKIIMNQTEMQTLKGHLKNIHFFSSDLCKHKTQINKRGNNGVTKYFKIPLEIRSRKRLIRNISYQKFENKENIFYIYTLTKEK